MRISRGAGPLGLGALLVLPLGAARPGDARPPPTGAATSASPHAVGPPLAYTGGFGEPTCTDCHVGFPLNGPGSTLEVLGLGPTYRPGEVHRVTVRLLSFDMQAGGFQATVRWAEGPRGGRSAGTLEPRDERVAVVPSEDGSVSYAQHTAAGTSVERGVAEWSFDWRAPGALGRLVLHVAANSANGDNSPLDDLVYTHEVSLTPRVEGR